eukprot:8438472-Alexandrium_andersonii.AAC.1
MTLPVADISSLVGAAAGSEERGVLKNTWIGELNDVRWFICLRGFPKSSCLLWPCDVVQVRGADSRRLQLGRGVRLP